jgi:hypothetical protein
MAAKSAKKNLSNTKQKVTDFFHQAKDSLKILETFEKETIAKAKSFVKIPNSTERKRMTNERILAGLKKIGVATQEEVNALKVKVQRLEATLQNRGKSSSAERAFMQPLSSEIEN